jgi:hypothetical protein
MSFPSGVLRWTGSWSATTEYRYGDIALASTNVSYACGVPTSLNVDPATQPSTDWFAFPNQNGGVAGVASLSGIQGAITQSCVNGTYTTAGQNVLLTIAYPAAPVQSVAAGLGMTNSGDSSAVVLDSAVQTIPILQGSLGVDGTEVPVWTTDPFIPTKTGTTVVNLSVQCSSGSDASPLLSLDLLLLDGGVPAGLGSLSFVRPPGTVANHVGYNGTIAGTIQTTAGTSYTLQLQGTCATVPGIANPWVVVSSRGYIQTNFPATAV